MAIGSTPTQVVFDTDSVAVVMVLIEPVFWQSEFVPEFKTYMEVFSDELRAMG
jgi:hypothetical protein